MTKAHPSKDQPAPATTAKDPAQTAAEQGTSRTFIGHHQQIDHALQRLQQAAESLSPPPSGDGDSPDTLPDCLPDRLIAALTDVREAAAEHFAHEEKLMEDTGFSQTDEHRQTHRFFLTLIQMELESLHRGTFGRGDPLCQTLGSWLISHSRHQDAELALFLCRGGPAAQNA
ncbi:bacteriohemerythrin [Novispirillum itersonii]|uniref:Hemerythrin-like metal-binding protein n=1 Tax=Novispirillum itersonii TaxID=189 RepID=A0A7X0DMR7_NOVIT|nr:hemerythrin family protein [Novispirillum itersonii]MBB6209477.1 hemerythrin-like metal-binding protein [Novispirillum itersonii]